MLDFAQFLEKFDRIFVWSDLHVNHSKSIEYCNRPFFDVDQMNAHLIGNWLTIPGPDDLLINLGDVTWGGNEKINEILAHTQCTNMLIAGNHDYKKNDKLRNLNFDYISTEEKLIYGGAEFILAHIPIPIGRLGTSFQISGHLHDKIYEEDGIVSPYHRCVSVEQTNYEPILLFDVCEELLNRVVFDTI